MPRILHRNGWKTSELVCAVALALTGVLLTMDAWRDIIHIAMKDEESSQILLVPLVVGWLWWVRCRRIRYCHPVGRMIGPALVVMGWLMYSMGDWFLIESFWHGGAIIVVVGCFLTIMGTDVLKNFAPVFLALIFLIPVPGRVRQRVAIPMQTATATVTQRVLELSGITVQRSGNLLSIGGREVTIGEACNGIRMMFALVMVSYVFAFATPLRPYVRLLVIAASPLSAILCNVIRLVPTIWCYGSYPDWAERFHTIAGWAMLVFAFLMLMGIVSLLKWAILPVTQFTLAYD